MTEANGADTIQPVEQRLGSALQLVAFGDDLAHRHRVGFAAPKSSNDR